MTITSECWWFLTPHYPLLCMSREAWAAWAQGVFSVLAIGASAWLVWWQHKQEVNRERNRSHESRKDFFIAVVTIAQQAEFYAEAFVQAAWPAPLLQQTPLQNNHWTNAMQHVANQLSEIPLFEIVSTQLPHAVWTLRASVDALIQSQELKFSSAGLQYFPNKIEHTDAIQMLDRIKAAVMSLQTELQNTRANAMR